MDEQRAWLKSRRKKRLRITAVILSICLLVTTYPDILETVSALEADARGADGTVTVTGFAALPEETAAQSVPVGTVPDELNLPDTLAAYAIVASDDDAQTDADGSGTDDMGKKEDDAMEDTDKPDDATGGAADDADKSDDATGDAADDANRPGDGDSETPDDATDGGDGTENGSTDNTSSGDGTDDDNNSGDGAGNSADGAGADNAGDSSADNQPDAGDDAAEHTDTAAASTEPAAATASGSFTMPAYRSENVINMEMLTSTDGASADEGKATPVPASTDGTVADTAANRSDGTVADTAASRSDGTATDNVANSSTGGASIDNANNSATTDITPITITDITWQASPPTTARRKGFMYSRPSYRTAMPSRTALPCPKSP